MNKIYLVYIIALISLTALSQDDEQESRDHRNKLSKEYKEGERSPLTAIDKINFQALKFYDYNPEFVVDARFERIDEFEEIILKTSTTRTPTYTKYGYIHFNYRGKEYKLLVLQSEDLKSDPEYYNYLSLYFTDATNGKGSYKMGRYMELRAPLESTFMLNFNNTYNPYCAYSSRYSCPVPPQENKLPFAIEAGVKTGFHGRTKLR